MNFLMEYIYDVTSKLTSESSIAFFSLTFVFLITVIKTCNFFSFLTANIFS